MPMPMTRLYKILILLTIISLSAIPSMGQSGQTSVTGTIQDSNGTLYINSPYTVTFYDPGTSGKLPLLNGSTFQKSYSGLATNSSGVLSISLPDNNVIASTSGATGTQWTFSICTAAASYTTIFCIPPVTITITGASQDISAAVTAVAPLLPTSLSNPFIANGSYSGNNTYSGTGTHRGAETFASLNNILYVGIASGQYPSLQAAHDILPASGGTVFVTSTALPFGLGTAILSMAKPLHIILDDATFTYTGAAQAILCTSVNAPIIEGAGFQGGGSAGGTIISVTNTAANGFDISTCPGAIIRNLNIIGPGSGTGKGLIYTGNSGHIEDVVVKSFGGNGCEENGTRGNSNGVRWSGVRCVSNGGIGLNVFGANANLNKFEEVEVSLNTGLGAQIATATNIFDPLHSFSNNAGGIGVSFISGASQNRGVIYSDLGTQTVDLAEAAGANNNKIGFLSGQNYTDAGTNNSSEMPRYLAPAASAATPSYSFQGDNTTGFYDGGGGAVVFSSIGAAIELFSSTAHRLGSGKCIGWSSNADPTLAANDSGLCRDSAGVVDIGNGTAGDISGTLKLAHAAIGGGTLINLYKTVTDTPGAITVNNLTCTDRAVALAGSGTGAIIGIAAAYALDANIYLSPAQAVAGTLHYRICNSSGGNITLNAAAAFNLMVLQ